MGQSPDHLMFEQVWRADCRRSILLEGMPEAEASVRVYLVIVSRKGRLSMNVRCCTCWILYLLEAVRVGFCTCWMLYLVDGVLGGCCTRCMLYRVDAVLVVCWTQCLLMIMGSGNHERWLHSMFWHDCRVVDKRDPWGIRINMICGLYQVMWEIRCMTCLIGFRIPLLGVLTCRVGSHKCHIVNGKLTCTQNSLKFQILILVSLSPNISLFVVLNSTVNREYKIQSSSCFSHHYHYGLTPTTVYTEYSINPRSTILYSQQVFHLLSVISGWTSSYSALYISLITWINE